MAKVYSILVVMQVYMHKQSKKDNRDSTIQFLVSTHKQMEAITLQRLDAITEQTLSDQLGRMFKVIVRATTAQIKQLQGLLKVYDPNGIAFKYLAAAAFLRKKQINRLRGYREIQAQEEKPAPLVQRAQKKAQKRTFFGRIGSMLSSMNPFQSGSKFTNGNNIKPHKRQDKNSGLQRQSSNVMNQEQQQGDILGQGQEQAQQLLVEPLEERIRSKKYSKI